MVVVFCAGHKHRIHCSEGSIWLEYYSISTAAARREREVGVADAVTNTNRPSGQHREHQIKLPKATRCTNTDTRLFVSDVKSAELSVQEVCQCAPNKIELYFVQSHFSRFKHSRKLQGTNFTSDLHTQTFSQRYKHGHTHTPRRWAGRALNRTPKSSLVGGFVSTEHPLKGRYRPRRREMNLCQWQSWQARLCSSPLDLRTHNPHTHTPFVT